MSAQSPGKSPDSRLNRAGGGSKLGPLDGRVRGWRHWRADRWSRARFRREGWQFTLYAGIILCTFLVALNSITRQRDFWSDSMNYVDVARNIIGGKGIAQSTLGFNQPAIWGEGPLPTPLIAQPPLYPLMIAALGVAGMDCADAALVLNVIAYGLILVLCYLLSAKLYDYLTGLLVTACLLLYSPLRAVCTFGGSDASGLVFVLLAIVVLDKAREIPRTSAARTLLAGGLTGCAFAARYALVPLFVAGIAFLWAQQPALKSKIRLVFLYTVGFSAIALPILGRNLAIGGVLFPLPLPSTVGFSANAEDALLALFGGYFDRFGPSAQIIILGALLSTLVGFALVQKRIPGVLREAFPGSLPWLLIGWGILYFLFIVVQRTRMHFDPIGYRFVFPTAVVFMIVFAAVVRYTMRPRTAVLHGFLVLALCYVVYKEVKIFRTVLPYEATQVILSSDRLKWIASETTDNDVIVGDDAVEVAFYLRRPRIVSFSPYPYSTYVEYRDLISFVNRSPYLHERVFFVLRKRDMETKEWRDLFGAFVSDLRFGRCATYPRIVLRCELPDALVYEVLHENPVTSPAGGARGRKNVERSPGTQPT